jgi:hypothetical protein
MTSSGSPFEHFEKGVSYSGVFATPSTLELKRNGRRRRRMKDDEELASFSSSSNIRVPQPPTTLRPFVERSGPGKRPERTTRIAYIPWDVPAHNAKRQMNAARKEAAARRKRKSNRSRGSSSFSSGGHGKTRSSGVSKQEYSAISTIIPIYSTASDIIESKEIDIDGKFGVTVLKDLGGGRKVHQAGLD